MIPQVAATVDSQVIPDAPIDDPARQSRVEDEFGDMLFVIANIARRWKINPEEALRRSNAKFDAPLPLYRSTTRGPKPQTVRRHAHRNGGAVPGGEEAGAERMKGAGFALKEPRTQ